MLSYAFYIVIYGDRLWCFSLNLMNVMHRWALFLEPKNLPNVHNGTKFGSDSSIYLTKQILFFLYRRHDMIWYLHVLSFHFTCVACFSLYRWICGLSVFLSGVDVNVILILSLGFLICEKKGNKIQCVCVSKAESPSKYDMELYTSIALQ